MLTIFSLRRTFLLLCLVLGPVHLHSQTVTEEKIVADKISSYLTKCKTFQQVLQIREIVGDQYKHLVDSAFRSIPDVNPLNPHHTKRLSSEFKLRLHPVEKRIKFHKGVDLSAKKGTYIYAPASGVVSFAKKSMKGYGKRVSLTHRYGFKTVYGHLSVILVKVDQRVRKGDIIGLVGNTGLSTAPHLHYEVIKNEKHIDPLSTISNEVTKKSNTIIK